MHVRCEPLGQSSESLDAFYRAIDTFLELLREPGREMSIGLEAGQVIVTDNWRGLPNRTAFSGARHFEGCYVDWDAAEGVWRSALTRHARSEG